VLEATVNRFGALVRRVAWRHRLEGADLDEVLQDVRLRLWRAQAGSEQLSTLSTSYVYRAAASAALDLIRRRRRSEQSHELTHQAVGGEIDSAIDHLPNPSAGRENPEAVLERAEIGRAVMAAIERIPKSRRGVVRMYLVGHPPTEIAGLMGWTEPKTRNLLYRGLADLRGELTAMGYGPGAGMGA
jgi:RNA polymerase sigma factor (sigma-70 family)